MRWNIDLDSVPPAVTLTDVGDFGDFQIEARGPRDRIAGALAPYARWEDGYAWFRPDAVREAAGERAASDEWQAGFQALQAYAGENGFLHEDGSIRAHVEWV